MLNDEVDILEQRIKEYSDVVEGFIITESRFAFDGSSKRLWGNEFINENPQFSHKIRILEYEFPENLQNQSRLDRWGKEKFARQYLVSAISKLPDSSYVVLSDIDEFPSVSQLISASSRSYISSAPTPVVLGKLNLGSRSDKKWNTVRIGPSHLFTDLNHIRYEPAPEADGDLGIHATWLYGNLDEVMKKIRTTAHSEFDRDEEFISKIVGFAESYQISHLGRFHRRGFGLLDYIELNAFSPVQESLAKRRPEWIRNNSCQECKWKRICASFVLTQAWNSGDAPSENMVNFRKFIFALAYFLIYQAKRQWKRVVKKFTTLSATRSA